MNDKLPTWAQYLITAVLVFVTNGFLAAGIELFYALRAMDAGYVGLARVINTTLAIGATVLICIPLNAGIIRIIMGSTSKQLLWKRAILITLPVLALLLFTYLT